MVQGPGGIKPRLPWHNTNPNLSVTLLNCISNVIFIHQIQQRPSLYRPTEELLILRPHRYVPLEPVKIHSHKNRLAFLSTPFVLFHMGLLT